MKSLNNLVVIAWHTPRKCVRVLVSTTSIRLSKDNHDSWGKCTTSAERKTVMTAMLTVMSGMDPHKISETWDGYWLGCVEVGLTRLRVDHGETLWRDQDCYLEEMSLLPYY
jgi:hypothetical protein